MEPFKISLLNQYSKRSKTQKYLSIVLGIVYLIIPIIHLINNDFSFFTIFWIILAIGMFVSGYFYSKFSSSYFLLLDEKKITSKDSIFNKFNILWVNINKIKINPISISLFTKSSDEKKIHLQNLTYNNVLLVKSELQKFAKIKGVTIE